ncbi:Mut7-C RNAse domain-containing protein [Blastococcus sp. HT6-30]|uniref:Mut7-C RNAse domain-containing protein n=1 Tax=Blastococcus sp. HT6-30 TaxID=3144843 RepID=UPI0032191747
MAVDVTVAVPPALRFLLPARDRAVGVRRLRFDPDATLGHLVRAAGVPPTEVGSLRLDGEPAAPAARARPGSTLVIEERARPQAAPPGGYLLDVGLGTLARRLRLLGLDAAWSNRAEDADLVARAAADDRVLLTQDRGLLMRAAVRHGALARGAGTQAQLADVLDRFAPALAPLTRCPACGGVVRPVPKAEVAELLEPGTRRSVDEFARCTACGQVYWRGAHARRINALVRAAGARARPA